MTLILASASPRRQDLITKLNIPFEIAIPDIDETIDPKQPITQEVERLAIEKAQYIAQKNAYNDSRIILAADTVVVIDNTALGKPQDKTHAKHMLQRLSNNTCNVLTAYCLYQPSANKIQSKCVTSKVHFKRLDDHTINEYVATGEAMDKAGSFAIQGEGAKLIASIDGDMDAIIGLPIRDIRHDLLTFF